MNSSEIRSIAIDSASSYYRYLELNNKGIQEVKVHEINELPQKNGSLKLRLRLSAKLFDEEAIIFKSTKHNRQYNTEEVKIIEYDKD